MKPGLTVIELGSVQFRQRVYVAWSFVGLIVLFIQLLTWADYFSGPIVSITSYRTEGSLAAKLAPWFESVYGILGALTAFVVGVGVFRKKQWTADAMWVTAFACLIWCDQLINYFRPGFYFSANFTNVASWVTSIPGQIAPHADLVPAPYIWIIGVYVGGFLPMLRIVVNAVESIEKRLHIRSPLLSAVLALVLINVMTLSIELPLLRAGLFAYPATSHAWSIWGGQTYQYPLVEVLATSVFLYLMYSAMRVEKATGYLPCELGVERIGNAWQRGLMQQLARIGFVVALFLLFPLGITQIGPWHPDPFPQGYPRDLQVGWCGDQGEPYGPCPGPGVPWAVRPAKP